MLMEEECLFLHNELSLLDACMQPTSKDKKNSEILWSKQLMEEENPSS